MDGKEILVMENDKAIMTPNEQKQNAMNVVFVKKGIRLQTD